MDPLGCSQLSALEALFFAGLSDSFFKRTAVLSLRAPDYLDKKYRLLRLRLAMTGIESLFLVLMKLRLIYLPYPPHDPLPSKGGETHY